MWKTIQNEPNYEVSSWGQVRNKKTKLIKSLRFDRGGYLRVTLYPSGKTYSIHRLVCFAFLDKPDDCNYVNHKDGVKTNNSIDNLEWCTALHNVLHAYENGLNKHRDIVGDKNHQAKLSWEDVENIRSMHAKGTLLRDIAKIYNVQYNCVKRIVLNITWKK